MITVVFFCIYIQTNRFIFQSLVLHIVNYIIMTYFDSADKSFIRGWRNPVLSIFQSHLCPQVSFVTKRNHTLLIFQSSVSTSSVPCHHKKLHPFHLQKSSVSTRNPVLSKVIYVHKCPLSKTRNTAFSILLSHLCVHKCPRTIQETLCLASSKVICVHTCPR